MPEDRKIQPVEELKVKPVKSTQKSGRVPLGLKIVEYILIIDTALVAFNVIIRLSEAGIWMVEQMVLGAIFMALVWGIRHRAPWTLYGLILVPLYGILSPIILSQTFYFFSFVIDVIILYLVAKNRHYFTD